MKEEIERILQEEMKGTHLFLVELTVKGNRVDVFADGDCGVNVGECARLSHKIHRGLEEKGIDTGNYFFDVSSPGLDRALEQPREYRKNVGRRLQLRNNQNKILKGLLVYVDEQKIILKSGGGYNAKKETILFNQIKEANVTI